MAIDVMYIDNGRGVHIRQLDIVTGKEIIASKKKIFQQHLLNHQQYHIIDKSWCTEYDVTAVDVKTISCLDKKFAKINPDIIMAVIESNYLQFNLTDLWQACIEEDIKYSKSFSNQLDALKWIKKCMGLVQSINTYHHKKDANFMTINGNYSA